MLPTLRLPVLAGHLLELLHVHDERLVLVLDPSFLVLDPLKSKLRLICVANLDLGWPDAGDGALLCLEGLASLELSKHVKSTVHGFCSEIFVNLNYIEFKVSIFLIWSI